MTWRTLTLIALAVPLAILGCSCDSGKKRDAIIRASGERWVLAGRYVNPREYGPPSERWVGTIEVPDETFSRLVDVPMKTPDGETVLFPTVVGYSEPGNLLICEYDDWRDSGPIYDNVFRYDLATGRSRWIAKWRWDNTRGFAWSPDGSKIAFVASTRGGTPVVVMQYDVDDVYANKPLGSEDNNCLYYVSKDDQVMRVDLRTVVMQYDVHADKLEEVAGDACRFGDCTIRQRRPAYSEDGNRLYYVSKDRHVMRVDLRTKEPERLPFSEAIAVLTVKGKHLVYVRAVDKSASPRDARFEIVKVGLDAPDDSHAQAVYEWKGSLWWNFVSPSRRFILILWRYGYGGERRLLDVETGKTYWGGGLLGDGGFSPHSTVFVGSAP